MTLGPTATLITLKNFRFLITHLPHMCNTRPFVEDLEQYDTKLLVRVCSGHYDLSPLNIAKISVLELEYPDGSFPSKEIIARWLNIVETHFKDYPGTALAVHCRSGLGRSAVLVAIALIESGMLRGDAANLIRSERRGAFNTFQYDSLLKYESQNRLYGAANKVIAIERENAIAVEEPIPGASSRGTSNEERKKKKKNKFFLNKLFRM